MPSTLYVLPTSGFGPGLPTLEDDLAFRSRGADMRFFTFGVSLVDGGRPRDDRMVGLEVMVEDSMEDLTSDETVVNFSRTDAGT